MSRNIGFLLLAAGESKRLGRPKQLEPFQGKSLIRFMAEEILRVRGVDKNDLRVVLGAKAQSVENELAGLGLRTYFNPRYGEGMGGGISVGLAEFLRETPALEACLISVCDQTELRSAHLEDLLAAHRKRPGVICASAYGGVLGVPALFPKKFFPDLLALSGDHGGKKIIQAHLHEVEAVPFAGGEKDLDLAGDVL